MFYNLQPISIKVRANFDYANEGMKPLYKEMYPINLSYQNITFYLIDLFPL